MSLFQNTVISCGSATKVVAKTLCLFSEGGYMEEQSLYQYSNNRYQ